MARLTMVNDPHSDEVRARQRSRSIAMAIALVALAILMFTITIARMGVREAARAAGVRDARAGRRRRG